MTRAEKTHLIAAHFEVYADCPPAPGLYNQPRDAFPGRIATLAYDLWHETRNDSWLPP